MEKRVTFLFFVLLFIAVRGFSASNVSVVRVGETNPSTSAYVFGTGEQLSGQQFQTDGILTYNGYQYTVYYNLSRNVCIARRKMPVGSWEEVVLPYTNSADDAHNVIVMGICAKDGSIHLSYDHHNDDLHYCYSVAGSANDPEHMPWETASFSATTNVMDQAVPDVTYPRFISKPDGNLLFECRFHYSGYGDSYLREYDGDTKEWTLIGRYVQGMDVNSSNPLIINGQTLYSEDACAYINGMTYDNLGRLHVTWCWRDNYNGMSNHDFYYAYSEDHGRTWKDTQGEQVATTQYMLPVVNRVTGSCLTQWKREKLMIEAIPYNRGYINQETQDVDSKGRIHAVNSHIPTGTGDDGNWASSRTKARLHHRFRDSDGTWKNIQLKKNGNTVHSSCRVNLSFDAFDNAYVVANGAEVYAATDAHNFEDWDIVSGVDAGRFLSEPLVDRPLLRNDGVLSFVYLGADKKITVIDYLTQNPNVPTGTGLLAEYFSDDSFTTLISSETVATPDQSTIPAGTQSIRWSGTFETLQGEEYTLYLNTNSETSVYINSRQALYSKPAAGAEESSFQYLLIPSHKNNIVIEAKTSESVSLSWSSASTTKELIPATSLYPEKANGELGEVTPPVLDGKVELDELLSDGEILNTSGKQTFAVTPFDPSGEYSLEVKAKINAAEGRGMDIEARSKTGKGFRVSLDETSINWTTALSSPEQIAFADNANEQVYRFAVTGGKVHMYQGKKFIGTREVDFIKEIQADDTESASAGTYGQDIMGLWAGPNNAGTGAPDAYGWECTASAPWNTAGSASGVRYLDNQEHNYNGNAYTGRLMVIRWDSDPLLSAYYSYPVALEANTAYEFSMLYEYWANATTTGVTMTVGLSTTKDASGLIDSETFTTGAQNTLQKGTFSFASQEAGQYYLIFGGGARAMYGLGDLSLKSVAYEPRLLLGKNYEGGNLDAELFYVSYQEGAYAAAEEDTEVETPELEEKAVLPTQLQNALTISGASGAKEIYRLDFNPTSDYSVEVSARILSAEGRGLDLEARSGEGKGFRTSMNTNTLRFTAPFDNEWASISKTDNTQTQIIRYAVQGEKVHVYQDHAYLKSYSIAEIGNMNEAGTAEELTADAKPDPIKDGINLIGNPDFRTGGDNAAPAGWLSDITLGGSPNPRIQVNNAEIPGTDSQRAAFMFRFDGNGGTYYAYPVTLKTNAWYEYSFDLIAWGANTNVEFDVVVSTVKEASDGIVAVQTVQTPGVRATAERQTLRFYTQTDVEAVELDYFLVFRKKGTVGTIGVTDLYLYEPGLNQLLFGKNYAEGAANIEIDYITVDYSGAYAPKEGGPDHISGNASMQTIVVYTAHNELHLKNLQKDSLVSVFDITGRCLMSEKVSRDHISLQVSNGVYIVKVNEERVRVLVQ